MSNIKKLETLVKTDIMPEVKETIAELEEEIKRVKKNKDLKEELDYMREIRKYFNEILLDIDNNSITEDQALDILEGLEDMRAENQEV